MKPDDYEILVQMPNTLSPLRRLALLKVARFRLNDNIPESTIEWGMFHDHNQSLVDFAVELLNTPIVITMFEGENNEEPVWCGTPGEVRATNPGDEEIDQALLILFGGASEVRVGGGAQPITILRMTIT